MTDIQHAPSSDDLVDAGEEHHKAGRLQQAESYYRQALELDPGHPGAMYYLANIAYEDDRLELAAQLINALLRDEPNDAEAWHLAGMVALKEKDLSKAGECLSRAVTIQPALVHVHYSLGDILSRQGESAAAATSFERAIALNPHFVEAYIGRGSALANLRQYSEALVCYDNALALNPELAWAHNGRGIVLKDLERLGDAIASFDRAIALNPNFADAYNNRGIVLMLLGRAREAVISFQLAITMKPQDVHTLENLGKAFYSLGEIDKAAELYRQWLMQEPDNPVARHHLAACTRDAVPERAGDAYVEHTFDDFAENFDKVLGQLNYRAPQILTEVLQDVCGVAHKQFSVLDAGCGTGLCGPLIAEYCAELIGVDLSEGMLAKARLRNIYDDLIKAELTAYLQAQSDVFDIILSADTLVYFGALEAVLAAARNAMHDSGYLFFTVEAFTSQDLGSTSELDYRLNTNGRYRHNEAYLRRVLDSAGFSVIAIETAIMRYEGGNPVRGFVVSCRAMPSV